LLSEVGALGFGHAADQKLQGTYVPPPETDPWAAQLIPFLKQEIHKASIKKLLLACACSKWAHQQGQSNNKVDKILSIKETFDWDTSTLYV
jgi:hypothetical protein